MAFLPIVLIISFLMTKSAGFHLHQLSRPSTTVFSSAGPRGEGRRTASPRSTTTSRSQGTATPRQQPPRTAFDAKTLVSNQFANHDAPPLDLSSQNSTLRVVGNIGHTPLLDQISSNTCRRILQPSFRFLSLDDIFPGLDFSLKFNTNSEFRNVLRDSMRMDIFDATPQYQGLSDKAKAMLLLPDSSLQGSWRTPGEHGRMNRLTAVLKDGLGINAPTGDDVMHTIGGICGSTPTTHWIDIVGVLDRIVHHSWHQDSGRSPGGDTKTVLWGFPMENNYEGTGVFSHIVPLEHECIAPDGHPRMEPVLFQGLVNEEFIVKPSYGKGRELLIYRDIDVLHSSPDVIFRTSVMRFM